MASQRRNNHRPHQHDSNGGNNRTDDQQPRRNRLLQSHGKHERLVGQRELPLMAIDLVDNGERDDESDHKHPVEGIRLTVNPQGKERLYPELTRLALQRLVWWIREPTLIHDERHRQKVLAVNGVHVS